VLIKDVDRLYTLPQPQGAEAIFKNNSLALGAAYANGGTYEFGSNFGAVRSSQAGDLIYGNSALVYGVGAFKYINGWYQIQRGFLYFDTNSIPDGATILEAALFIWKEAGDTQQEIAVFKGTQADILSINDYGKFTGNCLGESTPGGLGYRRISFNTEGLAAINKAGYTRLCLRERNYDYLNQAPTQNYSSFKTYFSGAPAGKVNYLWIKWITI
jgi:hypothetical protein